MKKINKSQWTQIYSGLNPMIARNFGLRSNSSFIGLVTFLKLKIETEKQTIGLIIGNDFKIKNIHSLLWKSWNKNGIYKISSPVQIKIIKDV